MLALSLRATHVTAPDDTTLLPGFGCPLPAGHLQATIFVPVHPIDPVVGIADGWTMTASQMTCRSITMSHTYSACLLACSLALALQTARANRRAQQSRCPRGIALCWRPSGSARSPMSAATKPMRPARPNGPSLGPRPCSMTVAANKWATTLVLRHLASEGWLESHRQPVGAGPGRQRRHSLSTGQGQPGRR